MCLCLNVVVTPSFSTSPLCPCLTGKLGPGQLSECLLLLRGKMEMGSRVPQSKYESVKDNNGCMAVDKAQVSGATIRPSLPFV